MLKTASLGGQTNLLHIKDSDVQTLDRIWPRGGGRRGLDLRGSDVGPPKPKKTSDFALF